MPVWPQARILRLRRSEVKHMALRRIHGPGTTPLVKHLAPRHNNNISNIHVFDDSHFQFHYLVKPLPRLWMNETRGKFTTAALLAHLPSHQVSPGSRHPPSRPDSLRTQGSRIYPSPLGCWVSGDISGIRHVVARTGAACFHAERLTGPYGNPSMPSQDHGTRPR